MRTIPLLLLLTLLSCEKEEAMPVKEYHYSVIERGTQNNPVWLREPILRKKGSEYTFFADEDNTPHVFTGAAYITKENLDRENADMVIVEISIVSVCN